MKCAVNQRQVVIALTAGELVYFEMDPVSDTPVIILRSQFGMHNPRVQIIYLICTQIICAEIDRSCSEYVRIEYTLFGTRM